MTSYNDCLREGESRPHSDGGAGRALGVVRAPRAPRGLPEGSEPSDHGHRVCLRKDTSFIVRRAHGGGFRKPNRPAGEKLLLLYSKIHMKSPVLVVGHGSSFVHLATSVVGVV